MEIYIYIYIVYTKQAALQYKKDDCSFAASPARPLLTVWGWRAYCCAPHIFGASSIHLFRVHLQQCLHFFELAENASVVQLVLALHKIKYSSVVIPGTVIYGKMWYKGHYEGSPCPLEDDIFLMRRWALSVCARQPRLKQAGWSLISLHLQTSIYS